MRVYLPATVAMLRDLVERGEFAPVGGTGFALTPALRESYATGDTEELEYSAMLDAARASLRLLSNEDKPVPRRAVVSVDVEDVKLRPDLDFSVVKIAGPIPFKQIAAIHLDTSDAEDAVAEAVEVVDAADLGDSDAEFALGEAEDHELAWYAAQELPFVLELM
ncbi:hypothetical protein ABZ816_19830 [Actinosynnema sp. NPDC047251]|uniref:Uncharacterized protein n=1 Tax=Saccharothrix espanaensis (strain ATCC 51144 / DSM 44229 / JCM 9112 / NBRC 15066 / NRRL 15764) TaxID=1179773 RepID=K0K8V7_SACES|nr:hypothetical protein [Saccharothrix espanaensis]CCH34816.1 hypothetical protein BN6_75910 [Saccharothrix espanaensis DSM 44229]